MSIAFPWFNTRIGSQTISPRYYFSEDGALVETARGLLEMGSDVIKFNLSSSAYLNLKVDPSIQTLRDLAERQPDFQAVLEMPFHYFLFWAQPHLDGMQADLQLSAGQEKALYDEIYQLSAYLLTHFSGSGKVFLIGQWEADWVLLGGFDPTREVSEQCTQGMVRHLQVRQRAVEDARRTIPHENVWVGHYAEVNRPLDAKVRGLRRMANAILPQVPVDLVSYSAYDAVWPNRITEALDYIESQTLFTSYFDGMFEKKVFIGEYDAYRDYHQRGYFAPEKQAENVLEVITSGMAWGAPFILFWEYYNNEHERLIHGGGFWLVDDQGVKQPVYYLHRSLLARINALKNLYRFWFGRNPREKELNGWADLLSRKRLSQITEILLNSSEFAAEVSADAFAKKAAASIWGSSVDHQEAARACLEEVNAGQSRFQALLNLLDSQALAGAIATTDYIRALRLDKRLIEDSVRRSALWMEMLDSVIFLEEELALRFAEKEGADLHVSRYFPFSLRR